VGLNVYPVDPEASREWNLFFMRRDLQDAVRRMRSRLKDQSLTDSGRERLARWFERDIERRQIDRYERESEVHPNLKAGAPEVNFDDLIPSQRAPAPPASAPWAPTSPPGFTLDVPWAPK
jgi:hypothetical protein